MLPLTSTTLNDLNNNQLKLKLRTGIDTRLIGEWDRFIEDHVHGSVLQSFFSYQLFDQTKFLPLYFSLALTMRTDCRVWFWVC